MNPYPYTALPDLTGGACLEPDVLIGPDGKWQDLFHPQGPGSKQQEREALKVCRSCPDAVRTRCLADILAYEDRTGICHGVAGGLTEGERARLIGGRVGS